MRACVCAGVCMHVFIYEIYICECIYASVPYVCNCMCVCMYVLGSYGCVCVCV